MSFQLAGVEAATTDLRKEISFLRDETAVKTLDTELQATRSALHAAEQMRDDLATLLDEVVIIACSRRSAACHLFVFSSAE